MHVVFHDILQIPDERLTLETPKETQTIKRKGEKDCQVMFDVRAYLILMATTINLATMQADSQFDSEG